MKTLQELNEQIGSLHDAVLLTIEMRWAEGTVTLGVNSASGVKRIIVEQVTRLECPREYPWGRSVCINELRFGLPLSTVGFEIEIEMQSGDVLLIYGGAVRVDP